MSKLKIGCILYIFFFLFSCVFFPWFPGGGYWTIMNIITVRENIKIMLNPDDSLLYDNRGMLRNEWGDVYGAESDFTKMIEILTKNNEFSNNLANAYDQRCLVYRRRGDIESDHSNLDQAMKFYQLAIKDCYQAADIFQKVGNTSASESVLFNIQFVKKKLSQLQK